MTSPTLFYALRLRAEEEPLNVDISSYSDEFCAGFLAGQVNVLEEIEAGRLVLPTPTERLADALAEIESKARWYADNDARDPHEVDHALCVEILDLAERALNA